MKTKETSLTTSAAIEAGYRLTLPAEVQPFVTIGSSFQITVDETGRIILTPEGQVQDVLRATFGIWAGRADLAVDGVAYMDEVRKGQRLNAQTAWPDETD